MEKYYTDNIENKKRSKGKAVFILIAAILILASLFTFYYINKKNNDSIVSDYKAFITALYNGEYYLLENMALGEVKFNIETNKINKSFNVDIINIDTYLTVNNKYHSELYSTIEYMMDDELYYDFTKAKLIKIDESYKIYKLESTEPYCYIYKNKGNIDISNAENILKEYIKALEEKEYKKAGKYLIGQAKKAHNLTSDILKKATLVNEPKDFESFFLAGGKEYLKIMTVYTNDHREVSVIVSFFNTQEGWKIYDISQV